MTAPLPPGLLLLQCLQAPSVLLARQEMQALLGHAARQEVSVRPCVQQLGWRAAPLWQHANSTSLQLNRAATDYSLAVLLSGSVTA